MQAWLQTTQQQISRQLNNNKLPHALLFSGMEGAGHEELALWLIKVLLCQQKQVDHLHIVHSCEYCKTCQLFTSNSYPDHITLSTKKTSIGVEDVRVLSQFFEKTAHIGSIKTAWIKQADSMTTSAANALLKTLEEPTTDSFIILTVNNVETLLPTIISRCQQFNIRPPVGENLSALCANNQKSSSQHKQENQQSPDLFANLSHYSELSDVNVANEYQVFRHNITQYLCYHAQRDEILNTLIDNNNAMRWLEKVIVDLTREKWHWGTNTQNNVKSTITTEKLWQIYQIVQAVNIKLKTLGQVNRQFLSEKLLFDISYVVKDIEG